MKHPDAPPMLTYVSGTEASHTPGWGIAFWLGIAYLLLLGLLLAADIWPMRFSLTFLTGTVWQPRNIPLVLVHTIPPVLACLNVLPVIGCALAARGRSPRKPLLLYGAVQTPLLAVVLAAAAYVAWRGRFPFSGGTVQVHPRAFVTAGAASLLLSLPLVVLSLGHALHTAARSGSIAPDSAPPWFPLGAFASGNRSVWSDPVGVGSVRLFRLCRLVRSFEMTPAKPPGRGVCFDVCEDATSAGRS